MSTETVQPKHDTPETESTETQAAKPPVLWILGVIALVVVAIFLAR